MANNKLVTVDALQYNNEKIKEKLAEKIDIQQNTTDNGKLLGIGVDGKVIPVEAPNSVDISNEVDNQIEQKQDGIYVKDMSAKISAEVNNALVSKQDGLYVPTTSETKVSAEAENQIEVKQDGIYVAPTDLSNYAKTEDLPSEYDDTEVKELITNLIDTKADKTELDDYVTDTELTDKGYATEIFVTNKIAEAQLDGSDVDLTGLATKNELALKADATHTHTLADITDYTIPDLSEYALKTEIPSTDGFATETYVDDAIANAQLSNEEVDLSAYVKQTDLDVQLEDYVLDEEIEIITAEQIEELIGLSADEIVGLASLLSDQEISISHTWSSSKIYSELTNTLDSAKAYTLSELAKSIGASYKVVTSTSDMVSDKVLYLLKENDTYNIYIFDTDTSTVELIGTFEVSLDDYMTRTELSDTFATKADVTANFATKTELQDYATKTEVVDTYATKEELSDLQDAVDNATVEISEETGNLLESKDDGLFVGTNEEELTYAEYLALDEDTRNNGTTYYVPDAPQVVTEYTIDDNAEANENVLWSSKKINDSLNDVSDVFYSTDISNFESNLVDITTTQVTSVGKVKQLLMSLTPKSDISTWTTFINIVNESLAPYSTTYGYIFHANILDGFVQIHPSQGIKTSGMTLTSGATYTMVITYIGKA